MCSNIFIQRENIRINPYKLHFTIRSLYMYMKNACIFLFGFGKNRMQEVKEKPKKRKRKSGKSVSLFFAFSFFLFLNIMWAHARKKEITLQEKSRMDAKL